jgi:hypothetical protein
VLINFVDSFSRAGASEDVRIRSSGWKGTERY